ncbi:MAG: DinB family protein [Alphaproteobacteria bacterium]
MRDYFQTLAKYNAWPNDRLYDAAAALTDEEYRQDVGVFFGSMHRTLNHILVGDRVWWQRVDGKGEAPTDLAAILFDGFVDLRAARKAEDARIIETVENLSEVSTATNFDYTNLRTGVHYKGQPLALTLGHIFNHQTHHRGQAHGILSLLGKTPPELDILYFIR